MEWENSHDTEEHKTVYLVLHNILDLIEHQHVGELCIFVMTHTKMKNAKQGQLWVWN